VSRLHVLIQSLRCTTGFLHACRQPYGCGKHTHQLRTQPFLTQRHSGHPVVVHIKAPAGSAADWSSRYEGSSLGTTQAATTAFSSQKYVATG